LSRLLVSFSNSIERRLVSNNLSMTSKEDLDKAIELTVNAEEGGQSGQEADILKGIVKFSDHQVKQIMKPRIDVVAIEIEENYSSLMTMVKNSGYSRIPVFEEDFDSIKGILYVKDLLGHTQEENDFKWQELIRDQVLYVPESKKIDELLKEFQSKRMHMAIIVDEYGGSAGIVTLEDIMEEVVGDIRDEFDEDQEVDYIQIGKDNYMFEGKTLLNDVCRIIGEDTSIFDEEKGEADSLAGLILEITGVIPKQEKEITVGKTLLKVISVNKRRIEKINVRKK
jgi:putative hemolysin